MDTDTHSSGRIIAGLLASLFAAALVTVLFVMPAEYGRDLTGIGSALGLTRLSAIPDLQPARLKMEGAFPAIDEEFDEYEPPLIGQPFGNTSDTPFSSDRLTITLEPGEQVEYKALMEQGDMLVFSWTADAAEIYCDFHADPGGDRSAYPKGYFIRYEESEQPASHGSIVAPFAGNHGWYWLNYNEQPVTIELRVSGYYDDIHELGRSFQY